jgi:SP family general alpha glucoside:H+ symporter-like MFS transporter
MNVSTIFFRSAGIEQTIAFDLTIATYGMGIVGTIKSWFLMAQLGRRTIYLWGVSTLCILLIIMGGLSFGQNVTSKMALAVMLLIFAFIYDATVGPVCYAIVAEVPSQQLKSKTIVIARILYNVGGIFANILTNYQITEQPSGWGWGGKTAFFWAASAFLCVVWVYFRLVEPKGRSYGEMTILFEAGVSAREFGDKTMDIFRGDHVTPAPSRPGSRHPSTLHLPLPDVEKEEKVGSAVAELGSGSSQSSLPV